MRILFLTSMPHLVTFGGANKAIRLTAERLVGEGHSVGVAGSLFGEGPGRITSAEVTASGLAPVEADGLCVLETTLKGVSYLGIDPLAQGLFRLKAAVHNYAPEVILVAGEDTSGSLLALALGYDVERSAVFAQTPDLLPLKSTVGGRGRYRELIGRAAALIVTSAYAEQAAAAAGFDRASFVVPPVFDAEPPCVGSPDGPVVMVNPSAIKGIDTFLALALARPERQFAAVPLWATTDSDRARLKATANVDLVAPHADVAGVLTGASVLVVPSTWNENFPLTLVEALGLGIPAITSDVGGLREAGLGVAKIVEAAKSAPAGPSAQNLDVWLKHLDTLAERRRWQAESAASHAAAKAFASRHNATAFEAHILEAVPAARSRRTTHDAAALHRQGEQ